MEAANSPQVISYIRWSSGKQRRNTSLKRQEELAVKYAERHNMPLSKVIIDDGVSGFSGDNTSSKGGLGAFKESLDQFPKGSVLVCENIDRISRMHPDDAYDVIRDIVKGGIKIVVYSGDDNVFEIKSHNDLGTIIKVIVELERAHSESKSKSQRTSKAFHKMLEGYEGGIIKSGQEPSWVKRKLGENNSPVGYTEIPERTAVIRKMFQLYEGGNGATLIAKALNAEGLKTFSKNTDWSSSSVEAIMKSRSLMGEAKFKSMLNDKPFIFADYYPVVISKEQFERCENIRKNRHNSKGVSTRNPSFLTGLGIAKCGYCGSSYVSQQASSKDKVLDKDGQIKDWARRLRCQGQASKGSTVCTAGTFKASILERAVIKYCADQVHMEEIINYTQSNQEKEALEQIAKYKKKLRELNNQEDRLVDELSFGAKISKKALERIRTNLENVSISIDTTKTEIARLEKEVTTSSPETLREHLQQITALQESLMQSGDNESRLKLRDIMMDIVERIEIFRYGLGHKLDRKKLAEDTGLKIHHPTVKRILDDSGVQCKTNKNLVFRIRFKNGHQKDIWTNTSADFWTIKSIPIEGESSTQSYLIHPLKW
ncbi:recombinase family protein [Pseudoalteromonas xiamenensis]|uniref:Recombinase family protein n=1 Tax=Pseudoalteromonas xiamenensis TaxID=882626 RepID=A0A975HM11_9GAMM|nr:recombinase family protein [Pseudoalteromonas xiamenensis]QTH70585.1 recombinase family protein [Pseudoalteromonas xiamenensis]